MRGAVEQAGWILVTICTVGLAARATGQSSPYLPSGQNETADSSGVWVTPPLRVSAPPAVAPPVKKAMAPVAPAAPPSAPPVAASTMPTPVSPYAIRNISDKKTATSPSTAAPRSGSSLGQKSSLPRPTMAGAAPAVEKPAVASGAREIPERRPVLAPKPVVINAPTEPQPMMTTQALPQINPPEVEKEEVIAKPQILTISEGPAPSCGPKVLNLAPPETASKPPAPKVLEVTPASEVAVVRPKTIQREETPVAITAPAAPAEPYVTTGTIVFSGPEESALPVGSDNLKDQLKQRIATACAGQAKEVEVTISSPTSLVVDVKVSSLASITQLSDTIMKLPELAGYQLSLKVHVVQGTGLQAN